MSKKTQGQPKMIQVETNTAENVKEHEPEIIQKVLAPVCKLEQIKKFIQKTAYSPDIEDAVKGTAQETETAILDVILSSQSLDSNTQAQLVTDKSKHQKFSVFNKPIEPFEDTLKRMRVKQTVREKERLEKKLRYIEENIGLLSAQQLEASSHQVKEYSWLTADERNKWKDDWMKKAQDAEEFTKKVSQIQKEIKKRKNEKQKLKKEKEAKELEEKQKQDKLKEEEEQKLKLEEKQKKIEEFEQKRKETKEIVKLANEKLPKKTYLYQKMTDYYTNEIEMPELEKRKREIAEKRIIYKPIRMTDLEEFQKTHDEQIKKEEEERKKEHLRKSMEVIKYKEMVEKQLKSVFTDEILKSDKETKEKMKTLEELPKEKYTKMKNYAKLVKTNFVPEINEAKALELKEQIGRLKHPVRKAIDKPLTKVTTPKSEKKEKTHRSTAKKSVKDLSKSSQKMEEEEEARKPLKIDYLMELKKNREEKQKNECVSVQQNYERLIQDEKLSQNDKYLLIKAQTDVMEQNARRKELLLSIKGSTAKNMDISKEVSDMYINAMKAKLSLLDSQ